MPGAIEKVIMSKRKYSFWFMPAGPAERKFSRLIVQLAEHYSSPIFPPHVTLIGSIDADEEEIVGKAQELAALIHPFSLQLTAIASTDAYYRALFVKADPSTALLAAYQQSRRLFPGGQKLDYMPHLSLLYGNFSVETKKEMVKRIGESFTETFKVDTLYLYLTDGAVGAWQRIRAFSLTI